MYFFMYKKAALERVIYIYFLALVAKPSTTFAPPNTQYLEN